ncbi:hypothetical protein GF319_14715 [Candidatus Bathyarchaeota archaeon]|nr:hypothetical protein [Candidatus Bathyarchaeota archaeon]
MILQLLLLMIAVLGASVYTLIKEEKKTGFAKGHDKFRFTLFGVLGVSLGLWFFLGSYGPWLAVAIAWAYLVFSFFR